MRKLFYAGVVNLSIITAVFSVNMAYADTDIQVQEHHNDEGCDPTSQTCDPAWGRVETHRDKNGNITFMRLEGCDSEGNCEIWECTATQCECVAE